jgi:hypothetical protein
MPPGVLQRSQRRTIGQADQALIPRHDATPQQNLRYKKKRRDSFRRPAVAGPRGPIPRGRAGSPRIGCFQRLDVDTVEKN